MEVLTLASDQDPLQSRSALVLYGSETGNAQDVAEELSRLARRLRFTTRLCELDAVDLKQLVQQDIVLIAISTTGQGELPANAQKLWKLLRSVRLRPGCLQNLHFASFGLGDSSYPKFNWAHRKLYNRLVQLGAQPIISREEADEQDSEGLDGTFMPWLQKLRTELLDSYPLPAEIKAIPNETILTPQWVLEFINSAKSKDASSVTNNITTSPPPPPPQLSPGSDVPPSEILPIPGSFTATVAVNNRLTPEKHFQDTRLLTLTTEQHVPYKPGDTIAIYPKNFPSDVAQFLACMGWTAIADEPLRYVPIYAGNSSHDTLEQSKRYLAALQQKQPITLRWLATNFLDIMSVPKRSLFAWLKEFASDPDEKERLAEFTSTEPEDLQGLWDYTIRVRRSIVEALSDFNSLSVPWQWAVDIIPHMRNRQFSIASGGAIKYTLSPDGHHICRTTFDLLIAIVKYRTLIRRPRQGVCTRYIASLKTGQQLNITHQSGGLHFSAAQVNQPVLMIAPGTGVAPMRALIHERHQVRSTMHHGTITTAMNHPLSSPNSPDILFFGCRYHNIDFYFSDEWAKFTSTEELDLIPAFSRESPSKIPTGSVQLDQEEANKSSLDQQPREQPSPPTMTTTSGTSVVIVKSTPKRYVQHVVSENAAKVVDTLIRREGMVYVCGSSGKMPQAVRNALIDCLASPAGGMSPAAASAYLEGMEKAGRYRQETW